MFYGFLFRCSTISMINKKVITSLEETEVIHYLIGLFTSAVFFPTLVMPIITQVMSAFTPRSPSVAVTLIISVPCSDISLTLPTRNHSGTRVLFNRGHRGTAKFEFYREISRNSPFSARNREICIFFSKNRDFDVLPR